MSRDYINIEDDKDSHLINSDVYEILDPDYPFSYVTGEAKKRKGVAPPRAKESRYSYLRKYWPGASTDQAEANYERLLREQDGVCGVCAQPPKNGKPLHVDHCHTTGKVRGLLCAPCNTGVIATLDNQQHLINAGLNYLNKIS